MRFKFDKKNNWKCSKSVRITYLCNDHPLIPLFKHLNQWENSAEKEVNRRMKGDLAEPQVSLKQPIFHLSAYCLYDTSLLRLSALGMSALLNHYQLRMSLVAKENLSRISKDTKASFSPLMRKNQITSTRFFYVKYGLRPGAQDSVGTPCAQRNFATIANLTFEHNGTFKTLI